MMSSIQKFKEGYPNDDELEKELSKIEEMNISNIKKIDLRQKVIEKYRKEPEWFSFEKWHCNDDLVNELMMGYGIGSALSDDNEFEQANEIGRWGE